MMPSPVKLHHLLFAAACIRDIIDDDGATSAGALNVLARIHLGITDLMELIKTEHGHARRTGPFPD
jgi:hypothetical protein